LRFVVKSGQQGEGEQGQKAEVNLLRQKHYGGREGQRSEVRGRGERGERRIKVATKVGRGRKEKPLPIFSEGVSRVLCA